mmetsp:Transcript_48702/g.105665  ORF Transcript_48702/g.105665 Transcript_48702/m.105665 type:complete len:265 (-) Transcript_48702:511-1305(-)
MGDRRGPKPHLRREANHGRRRLPCFCGIQFWTQRDPQPGGDLARPTRRQRSPRQRVHLAVHSQLRPWSPVRLPQRPRPYVWRPPHRRRMERRRRGSQELVCGGHPELRLGQHGSGRRQQASQSTGDTQRHDHDRHHRLSHVRDMARVHAQRQPQHLPHHADGGWLGGPRQTRPNLPLPHTSGDVGAERPDDGLCSGQRPADHLPPRQHHTQLQCATGVDGSHALARWRGRVRWWGGNVGESSLVERLVGQAVWAQRLSPYHRYA